MSDRVESLGEGTSVTRREFTLEAALAILAGCVITVSDAACGSSPTTPTPVAPSDITGVVGAPLHGHTAVITGAQITAGSAFVLNIQGTATHNHTVQISQADLTSLKNRQPIARDSSTDNGHSHTVTFTPA
jgi:hypothetical protein